MSFISRDFTGFNWHSFAQLPVWRFLLWLSFMWRQSYLIQKIFLSIPSLTWTLALDNSLFCSVMKAFTMKGNKHKHTPHTHTHTHTHTHAILALICYLWLYPWILISIVNVKTVLRLATTSTVLVVYTCHKT